MHVKNLIRKTCLINRTNRFNFTADHENFDQFYLMKVLLSLIRIFIKDSKEGESFHNVSFLNLIARVVKLENLALKNYGIVERCLRVLSSASIINPDLFEESFGITFVLDRLKLEVDIIVYEHERGGGQLRMIDSRQCSLVKALVSSIVRYSDYSETGVFNTFFTEPYAATFVNILKYHKIFDEGVIFSSNFQFSGEKIIIAGIELK